MNFKHFLLKFAQIHIRFMSTKLKSKNHYNSLGIPSTSTQNEVKSAYYKLSMLYHPDKNQNNPEFSQKFRDITEAYEVLGNVKTRKLYDKGLYHGHTITVDDTVNKFHKSRETRSKPPPPSGRTPIYDFDEWSRSHYGAAFQRTMDSKKRQQFYKMSREEELDHRKMEKFLFVIAVLVATCMYLSRDTNYDEVSYVRNTIKSQMNKKDLKKD